MSKNRTNFSSSSVVQPPHHLLVQMTIFKKQQQKVPPPTVDDVENFGKPGGERRFLQKVEKKVKKSQIQVGTKNEKNWDDFGLFLTIFAAPT